MAIIPDNRFFNQQWHLKLIEVPEAWALLNGGDIPITNRAFGSPNIIVGVVDSGVQTIAGTPEHIGLQGNVSDGQSKGFVFLDDENPIVPGNNDSEGIHGTEVTGLITAKAQHNNALASYNYNGKGIIGVAPNTKYISISYDRTKIAQVTSFIYYLAGLTGIASELSSDLHRDTSIRGFGDITSLSSSLILFQSPQSNQLLNFPQTAQLAQTVQAARIAFTQNPITYQDPASVLNFSLTAPVDAPPHMNLYFELLTSFSRKGRGIVFCVGAGNSNIATNIEQGLAVYDYPIIVGATQIHNDYYQGPLPNPHKIEQKANYSSHGPELDIVAPAGGSIRESDYFRRKLYTTTIHNSGEFYANSPLQLSIISIRGNDVELNNVNGVYVGQYVSIGNPNDINNFDIRRITNVQGPPTNTIALDERLHYADGNPPHNSLEVAPIYTRLTQTVNNSNVIQVESNKGMLASTTVADRQTIYIGPIGNGSTGGQEVKITAINSTIVAGATVYNITIDTNVTYNLSNNIYVIPQPLTKVISSVSGSNTLTLNNVEGLFVGGGILIPSFNSRHAGFITSMTPASNQITVGGFDLSSGPPLSGTNLQCVGFGHYSSDFTGTSGATPITSGVAALVLSAKPSLNVLEVKEILKASADKIDVAAGGAGTWKDATGNNISISGGSITTLANSVDAGQTIIQVTSATNLVEKSAIKIGSDENVINSISGNNITLQYPLQHSHNAGKSIKQSSQKPVHSDYYGAGRVNARKAVQAALNYNHDHRKLKIRDSLADNNQFPINSPDIWVRPNPDNLTPPLVPISTRQESGLSRHAQVKLNQMHKIYLRIINAGTHLPSLPGGYVRCLLAFTNDINPTFSFPDKWYHQRDESKTNGENIVYIGSTKLNDPIPADDANAQTSANSNDWNEKIIEIDWDASNGLFDWKTINPKGLNAYILTHIAPFDGEDHEVSLTNTVNNKQLTYKPIAPFYIWFTDDTGQHLDQPTKVEVPFSGATVNTSFATKIFGIHKDKVDKTYLKLTLKHTDSNIPDEVIKFKDEGGGNWGYVPNGIPDWVIVQNPDAPDLHVKDHKNLFFECGLTVSSRHSKVTVEVIDETTAGTEVILSSQVFTCSLPTAIPTGMQQNPTQPFHTFTDFTHLTQSDIQTYGPVKGHESTQFRTSALFTSTQTQKAYAVAGGTAFIQEIAATNLVNLVLKPDEQPIVNGMVVKYFIYRGLKKSSFLDASGQVLTESNSTNNDMLQRMWQVKDEWNQQQSEIKQNLNPPENHTPEGLKREDVGLATKNEDKLADTETIDRVFEHTFQPIIEGWQLGEFETSGNFGLEVVVDYPGHSNTLAEVRVLDHLIKVDPFAGNAADEDHLEEFDKLFAREKILGYVDPAAYYGAFYEFSLKNHVGSEVETIRGKAIKTQIIDKFSTQNNIYIDIRNELGNSINLYNTYKSVNNPPHIQLNGTSTDYQYHDWPIVRLEIINNSLADIKCQLPIGNNTDPILYLVTGAFKGNKDKFKILNAAGSNTNEFSLKVPEKDKQVFSYHFKITYNRRHRTLETVNGNISTGIFNRLGRYDNIFPFNQISVYTTKQGRTTWNTQGELRYLGNTSIADGKDVNLQIGAAKDTIGETMYGFVKLPTEVGGKDNYQVASYPLGLDGGEQQVATFLQYLDSLKFLNSVNSVSVNDPNVVDVIKFHTQAAETILQEDVQHLYSVSYTNDEATALTQAASIFDQRYPIYFVFQEGVYPKGAINKFKLALQGVVHDSTTNVYQTQIVSTTEPIWCYAFDDTSNSFFSSAYASAFKNLSK